MGRKRERQRTEQEPGRRKGEVSSHLTKKGGLILISHAV